MELEESEYKQFENFFFIVFEPNPVKDIVRVWIDGGYLRFTYKREKFYKIIQTLVNDDAMNAVHLASTYYGGFFLFNRQQCSVTRLSNASEKNVHLLSHLHKDIMNAKDEGSSYADVNFAERANDYLAQCDLAIPTSKVGYANRVNKKSGTVAYNVPTDGRYKPY